MQQIADWLEKLGLGQYAPRFAENDITFAILSDLTDQDLKELGVSSLGHRRQLLRAIAELNSVDKGALKLAPATAAPVTPQPHDVAERRQVTVMFSDLVGSTALSARMDPEDLREVISAYQKCVAETVRRFGGFVAKYISMPSRNHRSADQATSARSENRPRKSRQRPRLTIFLLYAAYRTPADVALERIFDELVAPQEGPGLGGFEVHHRPAIGTAGGHYRG